MQYRNDTAAALTVASDPPQVVEPGETVESASHIAGLTPLYDEPDDDERDTDVPAAPDPVDAPAPADTEPESEVTP